MPDFFSLIVLSCLLLAGLSAWLVLIFLFPAKWKALADKEYVFHCRNKWIPQKFALWQRDFSQGKSLKIALILMWSSLLLCLLSLWRTQVPE